MPVTFYLRCNSVRDSPSGHYVKFNHLSKEGFLETECHVEKNSIKVIDGLIGARMYTCKDEGRGHIYKIGVGTVKDSVQKEKGTTVSIVDYYIARDSILEFHSEKNR